MSACGRRSPASTRTGPMYRISACFCLFFVTIPVSIWAESPAGSVIAAKVGDDPVEVSEVQTLLDEVFQGKKPPTGDLLAMARAQVLEEIVTRRLVVAYARRTGDAPSDEELAKAIKERQTRLAAQGGKASGAVQGRSNHASGIRATGALAPLVSGSLPVQVPHSPTARGMVQSPPSRSRRHGPNCQPHSAPPNRGGPTTRGLRPC